MCGCSHRSDEGVGFLRAGVLGSWEPDSSPLGQQRVLLIMELFAHPPIHFKFKPGFRSFTARHSSFHEYLTVFIFMYLKRYPNLDLSLERGDFHLSLCVTILNVPFLLLPRRRGRKEVHCAVYICVSLYHSLRTGTSWEGDINSSGRSEDLMEASR